MNWNEGLKIKDLISEGRNFTAFQTSRRWCNDRGFVCQMWLRVRSGHGPEGAWPRCWPDHMGGLLWRQKMGSSHHSASFPSAIVQIDLWFLFCKMNFNILLLFPLERQQSCCIVYKKAETGWTSRSSWSRELVSISAKNEVNLLYTCHQHWDLTI